MRKTASRRVLNSVLGKGYFSVVVVGAFALGAAADPTVVKLAFVTGTEGGVVTTNMDASVDALRAAITAAPNAEKQKAEDYIIELAEGAWEITQRLVIDKPITLRGATNEDGSPRLKENGEPATEIKNTTLSGTQAGDKRAQVLRLSNNCRVESLVLSDGYLYAETGDNNAATGDKNIYRGSVLQMNNAVVTNCVIQGGRGYTQGNQNNNHSVGVFMDGTTEKDSAGKDVYLSRLENSIIRNNFNRQANEYYPGGGVFINNKGLVSNCVITNNLCHGPGGGVAVSATGDGCFINCVIKGNYGGFTIGSETDNAGNANVSDNMTTTAVKFTSTPHGGGAGGAWRGTFVNCLIAENYSKKGNEANAWTETNRKQPGAVSGATLYGCTVVSNMWDKMKNGWPSNNVYYAGLFNCAANNTLVWGNRVIDQGKETNNNNLKVYNWDSLCTLSYCWTSNFVGEAATGILLTDEPAFTNYTLSAAWPLKDFTYAFAPNPAEGVTFLNVGDIDNARLDLSAVDLDGQARDLDGSCDIGCLETKSKEEIFNLNVKNKDSRTHKSVGCDLEITGNTGKTVEYTLLVSTDNFATIADFVTVSQTGNGEKHLEVVGLNPGTTYAVRLKKTGEVDPVNSWDVTTHARSIHVVDDLTVDDGDDDKGITVRIDEIFSGSVTATVTVDGTYTTNATFTASDAPALITIKKSEYNYNDSSTVDAVFTATDSDGTVYEPLVLETGRKLFVDPGSDSDDANTGKYWAKPKKTIQSALEALNGTSCTNVTTIVLASGEYLQSNEVMINKAITVVGESGVTIKNTTINTSALRTILTIDHANAVVTNITVEGGLRVNDYTGGSRGVWIKQGLLVDSVVKNAAVAVAVDGAGVKLDGGEMRGCTVTGCFAKHVSSKGAGVFIGENALVDRCVISGNSANDAWVTEGSGPDPAGTPKGTASGEGAGVYLAGGTLRNSLVTGNVGAVNGGGVYLASGTVENCTIVTNTSTIVVNNTDEKYKPKGNETVAGVYIAGGSLVNSIVWDNVNTAGVKDVQSAGESNGTVTRCCFSEAEDGANGNISADPLFTDAADGDYSLSKASPCVDKGKRLTWFTGALDLAGNARLRGNAVDLGCYESEHSRAIGLIILVK